ncbi:MAG: cation:dicarboxylase symporter family transporter [Hyphomonadaceae bacterium]
MVRSLSFIVLLALIAGIVVGALIRGEAPALTGAAEVVEAFGGLWLNALRMTVVPLVFALLVVGGASVADAARAGGLVARAVLLFTVLIFVMALYGIAATQGLLALWPVAPDAAAAFIGEVGAERVAIAEPPTFVSWLQSLAPANPVSAAANDDILQLVVFALFFGFALTRLAAPLREQVVTFFRAVMEAMVVVVRWVLLAGPLGVFALSLGVGLRAGLGAGAVLAQYAVIVAGVTAGSVVIAWLIGVTWGRQPVGRFTAACAPVWAIAASTQSSLAAAGHARAALTRLKLPSHVADIILPLAVRGVPLHQPRRQPRRLLRDRTPLWA